MSELYVRNRQRTRPIDLPLLKRIAKALLDAACPGEYQFGLLLVGEREMARLNGTFLGHAGPTDVITFRYGTAASKALHSEVVVCVAEALGQARRFRTSWQQELVRYLVHGVLHCQGFDDTSPGKRAAMKKAENQLLRRLDRQFPLRALGRKTTATRSR